MPGLSGRLMDNQTHGPGRIRMSPEWTEAATMTIAASANQPQLPISRPTRPAIIAQN